LKIRIKIVLKKVVRFVLSNCIIATSCISRECEFKSEERDARKKVSYVGKAKGAVYLGLDIQLWIIAEPNPAIRESNSKKTKTFDKKNGLKG